MYFREKLVSFWEINREEIIIKFQPRQGIIIKAKYMKDNMNGLIAVNKQKIMYDFFVFGICQYFARRDMPNEKPSMPNILFNMGRISPFERRLIGINWVKRASNNPELMGTPSFRYFQSWSPNKKCELWYINIMFNDIKVTITESQKQESVILGSLLSVLAMLKLSMFLFKIIICLC